MSHVQFLTGILLISIEQIIVKQYLLLKLRYGFYELHLILARTSDWSHILLYWWYLMDWLINQNVKTTASSAVNMEDSATDVQTHAITSSTAQDSKTKTIAVSIFFFNL